MPGFRVLAAGALCVIFCLSRSAQAQNAPPVALPMDNAPPLPGDAMPGQVDNNNSQTLVPADSTAPVPPPDLVPVTVKPSEDVNPEVPPPAPVPILLSPMQYTSPFQFAHAGSLGESLLRGNGIHGGLSFGSTYDDNVFLANGQNSAKVSSISYFISPSLSFRHGGEDAFEQGSEDSIAMTYNGAASFYGDSHISPEYNSSFSLAGTLVFQKLTLGLTENTNIFTDALVGSSSRTQYRFFDTDLSAKFDWTPKTTSNHDFILAIANYQTGFSSYDLSSHNVVTHPVTDKLRMGVGFTAGLTVIQDSPSQPYQQALVTADYSNQRKLSAQLSIGGQFTELSNGHSLGLVYSGSVTDHPFDGTTLQLSVYRNNNSSADQLPAGLNNPVTGRFDADYTSTGGSLQVTQRLISRFSVTGVTGFELSDYYSASTGASLDQHFDYFYIGVSLSFAITRWGSFSTSYNYRQNTGRTDSNSLPADYFNFEDNVFSASLGVQF